MKRDVPLSPKNTASAPETDAPELSKKQRLAGKPPPVAAPARAAEPLARAAEPVEQQSAKRKAPHAAATAAAMRRSCMVSRRSCMVSIWSAALRCG